MRAYYFFMKFVRGFLTGLFAGVVAVAIIAVFAAAAYFAFFA